ncbi:Smr/MutS family protein [Sphingomonas sp. ST-64]|uniref:Smr/MutS family protein n=1 Tax=Sphingomonas plantiphila TaxID=3163295 RepID=A0ABW8YMH7_9SPHN
MTAEEQALWARVTASIKPLSREAPRPVQPLGPALDLSPPVVATQVPPKGRVPAPVSRPSQPSPAPPPRDTLDGGWDKRLSRGLVGPDTTLDLHGHTLASAHALLDRGLDRAIARGDRLMLLITGKPPRPESDRPHARGAIRAAVRDWLAASRHADRIAAVRGAHSRHGGQGALYIVLRRERSPTRKF